MKRFLVLVAALALFGAYAPGAFATVIVFNTCHKFSGAQAPEGPGPWLRCLIRRKPGGDRRVLPGGPGTRRTGTGFFDLKFAFEANEFTSGESMWVDLQRAGSTAASFDFASEGGGGAGIRKTAAHVHGVDGLLGENANSGWVGDCPPVPEPTSMLLLRLGLAGSGGLGMVRRRRNR